MLQIVNVSLSPRFLSSFQISDIYKINSVQKKDSKQHQLSTCMDKLRRSFRQSFRRKDDKDCGDDRSQGPSRQWPSDEMAVKSNNCSFEVKYLGSVEVGTKNTSELIIN